MEHMGGADKLQTAAHGGFQAAGRSYVTKEAAAQVEPPLEQVCSQELWPAENPHWSNLFLKDCTLCK